MGNFRKARYCASRTPIRLGEMKHRQRRFHGISIQGCPETWDFLRVLVLRRSALQERVETRDIRRGQIYFSTGAKSSERSHFVGVDVIQRVLKRVGPCRLSPGAFSSSSAVSLRGLETLCFPPRTQNRRTFDSRATSEVFRQVRSTAGRGIRLRSGISRETMKNGKSHIKTS